MKKILISVFLAVSVAMAGSVLALDKVRWRVPVSFSSELIGLGDTIVYVADVLKTASDGEIQFRVEEPGKIVPAFGIFDALKEGKIDAGYYWLGYDYGKVPASALFAATPFGLEPWEYMTWTYEGGGFELMKEVYAPHNIVPIPCGVVSPETAGWFKKEINTLDDLKGLKIRFAGVAGKVMQKLGASVTLLPAGELFQALERGVLDATEFSIPTSDIMLGFDKVAKYNYFPGWHQTFTSTHLAVNKEKWDELGEDTQAMIIMACTAGTGRAIAKSEAAQPGAIQEIQEKGGVTTQKLPDEVLLELREATVEVLVEEAAADANFKKVLESQQAFLKKYLPWRDLGYLPLHMRQGATEALNDKLGTKE